ncbi:uncharacterized protein F5147DRAFT_773337 [Suillus discolor]|uniref:Uncharacterized protein n=1 Tax=Suillus discolor TaxID=1912936 RepID=A0A9P7F985_9AGAM|nr:uncharacterized protein F5147DRAFT_773337 [Suillus discolor]KAG2109001.1 hypothetical protein F5147DRAFT_773337 [Suillus discolor]
MRKGRIKIAKPTPVAYMVDNFFAGIFVAGLDEILKGATLWMLVCGHMVHETESFKSFTTCVKHYDIANAFAFGAEGLHVCLTMPFIAAYVERILVEGFLVQEVMTSLLAVCPRLTMHASIIHIHVMNALRRRLPTIVEYNKGVMHIDDKASIIVSTYTFFDKNQRPWGNALPLQCSGCKCLHQWKRISPSLSDNGSVANQTVQVFFTFPPTWFSYSQHFTPLSVVPHTSISGHMNELASGLVFGVAGLGKLYVEARVTEALSKIQGGVEKMEKMEIIEGSSKAARKKRYMIMGLVTLGILIYSNQNVRQVHISILLDFCSVITTGGVQSDSGIAAQGMARRT